MIFNINMLRHVKNLTISINDDTDLVIKGSKDGQTIEINVSNTNSCTNDSSCQCTPPLYYPPNVK